MSDDKSHPVRLFPGPDPYIARNARPLGDFGIHSAAGLMGADVVGDQMLKNLAYKRNLKFPARFYLRVAVLVRFEDDRSP